MNNDKYYYPGDMIYEKNLIFKDTLKHDFRINGHPVLILTAANFGDKFYALKISGTYKYSEGLKNYYLLKPNKKKGIYKTSYIDLRYIYELECKNIPPYVAIITEKELKEIITKLQKVQLIIKNENYRYIEKYYNIKNVYNVGK